MHTNSTFRICLIVSISLHLFFFMLWPFLHFQSKPKVPFQKMELTYFNRAKTPDVPVAKITAPAAPKMSVLSEIKPVVANTTKLGISRDIGEKAFAKKDAPNPANEISVKTGEKLRAIAVDTEKMSDTNITIDIGALKGVVYEKYNHYIREKIRASIDGNKRGFLRESEIYVKFSIDKNGMLKSLCIYKSNGPDAESLEALAVKSIKEAAPFAPFSNNMKKDEIRFDLCVQYKKD